MERYNDLFINTKESLDKYLKAKTTVSILGGNQSEDSSRIIGNDVAKSGYSIRTGGYDIGAMKGGLIGGAEGLKSKDRGVDIDMCNGVYIKQKIEGVTSADFKPIEFAVKGEEISTNVAADPYERLRLLIRDADIVVITEGSIGTELEIYASFAFENELEILNNGRAEKPIIFVGENIKNKILSIPKFTEYLSKSKNVIFVNAPEDVINNVNVLFEKIREQKRRDVDM